jgi:hypothetical protein
LAKIVINECYGGFSISPKALETYHRKKNGQDSRLYWFELNMHGFGNSQYVPIDNPTDALFSVAYATKEPVEGESVSLREIPRNDPDLVATVEELGREANGRYAELKVVEIPDDVEWVIEEYDGLEWIAEKHRTWR